MDPEGALTTDGHRWTRILNRRKRRERRSMTESFGAQRHLCVFVSLHCYLLESRISNEIIWSLAGVVLTLPFRRGLCAAILQSFRSPRKISECAFPKILSCNDSVRSSLPSFPSVKSVKIGVNSCPLVVSVLGCGSPALGPLREAFRVICVIRGFPCVFFGCGSPRCGFA
jgi:hypothetical protein